MSGKSINFDDKKLKKVKFTKTKIVTEKNNIDVNKILVSKEEPYGTNNSFKYFIGYNDNDVIRPLCIKLSQMTGSAKKTKFNLTMSFKVSNKELLKKYDHKYWKQLKNYWKSWQQTCLRWWWEIHKNKNKNIPW